MSGNTSIHALDTSDLLTSGKPKWKPVRAINGAPYSASLVSEWDDQGDVVMPEKYAQTLTYSGSLVQTIAFTDGTSTWTKTFTYTGSDVTGISLWVKL